MGDWWIDESLPAGPVEQESFTRSFSGITLSPASKRALDKLRDKLSKDIPSIVIQWQGQMSSYYITDEVASAGIHSGGGAVDMFCQDVCCKPKDEPEPEPNRDKGRVNNTGPRRGQTFKRGRKRY